MIPETCSNPMVATLLCSVGMVALVVFLTKGGTK